LEDKGVPRRIRNLATRHRLKRIDDNAFIPVPDLLDADYPWLIERKKEQQLRMARGEIDEFDENYLKDLDPSLELAEFQQHLDTYG